MLAVLATALNLRMAVASVPPLLDELRSSVPLSGTAAGALTTLPVVCMAAGATIVPRLSRRMGHELPLVLVGIAMAAGILVRVVPGVAALYIGTMIAGIGIALGNVLVPSLVKRDFQERAGFMTGIYTMAIGTSAGLAAGLTVPIEDAIGHGWRPALAVWALPALIAAAIWVPFARHPSAVADRRTRTPHESSRLLHDRLAWQVALFMGVQSLMFYSLLSWLPSILRDNGMSKGTAGAYLSIFTLLGIPVSFAVPLIAARMRDQRTLAVVSVLSLALGVTGLVVSPGSAAIVWTVFLGISQAATLSLAFLYFVLRSRSQAESAELSSMSQSIGYALAAVGPIIMGALHEATGSWTWPLVFLLVLMVPELVFGVAAGRDRQVGS
ncbi:MAG TPA: MFS transporter [Thermoleophilaceae bacterium]|nr:MFS transporter [Thermoleophilaceae bacterium]